MTQSGKITKANAGYAMPVDAPLYANPPIHYRFAEAITISYETDAAAAANLLPEGLIVPEPATAAVVFVTYPFSTLGQYEETILCIPCLFNDELKIYIPHIVVNNDIPQIAGREIWGYPKKIAHITLTKEFDMVFGRMERPQGNLICSAGMRPETPLTEEDPVTGVLSLRVIPSPEENAPPSLMELIEVPQKNTVIDSFSGPGWVHFHIGSTLDPWHTLPVKQILGANYRVSHMELGYGKIVKRY